MPTTLFKNGIIVTMDPERRVLFGGGVLVDGDRIRSVLAPGEAMPPADAVVDCEGKIVLPGFVDTHTHLFQTLLKGMGDDMALDRWLATMTFPAARFLSPEHCYAAAMSGLLEGLRSGVTTTIDYTYPHNRGGLSVAVIKAFSDLGVRGVFGRGCMDTGEEFGVPPGIMQTNDEIEKDLVSLLDSYHDPQGGMMRIWLAPAVVWSSTAKNLQMLKRVKESYRTGLTIHISETPFDREATIKLHGKSDAEMLEQSGLVGPDVLMVHCVYLTERDRRMAAHYDLKVSHNAASNMYLSSGVAPVPGMLSQGITVGLGVDGAASNNSQDMLELMKLTALLHKVSSRDPTVITAEKVLEMATMDGARCLGMEAEIGSIEVGKRADLVVFNPAGSPKAVPLHNPASTIVYSSSERNVESVMVNGNMILKDGALVGPRKEESILAECQKAAEDLAKKGGMTNRMEGHQWRSFAF